MLMCPIYQTFSFPLMHFVTLSNIFRLKMMKICPCVFFLKSYGLPFAFRLMINLELIFGYSLRQDKSLVCVLLFFSPFGYLVASFSCPEELARSLLNLGDFLHKASDYVYAHLFLYLLFYIIGLFTHHFRNIKLP